ncbi:MAG: hypothetical protein GX269_05345 [Clostridiales bacterium]|nr:hypothetical protein [Clostridiales bacterium]
MKNKKGIIVSILVLLIVIVALFLMFKPSKHTGQINLSKENYSGGEEFSLLQSKNLSCIMNIPEDGKVTLYIVDYTAYIEENKKLKMEVSIKDSDNKIIDKKVVGANKAYTFLTQVKKADYKIEVKLIGSTSKDNIVYVSWGYAPKDLDNKVEVDGKIATTIIDKNGIASFNINVEKNMLVDIGGGDACIPEGYFEFSVLDKNNDEIVSDVRISKTEWQSRKVFLSKGSYKIEMKNLIKNSIAKCTVKSVENYNEVQGNLDEFKLEKDKPLYIGFDKNINAPQKIKFKTAKNSKELSIAIVGNSTYYDNVSSAKIVITDSSGKKIFDQIEEESFILDISKYDGDYFIYISKNDNDNFVVKLSIE